MSQAACAPGSSSSDADAQPATAPVVPSLDWRLAAGSYVVAAKSDDPLVRPARARLIWAANTAQAMHNLGVRSLLVGTSAGLPFKVDTIVGKAAVRRYIAHLYGVNADFEIRVLNHASAETPAKHLTSWEWPRYVLPDAGLVHTRDPRVAVECAKRRINYVLEHHDEAYQNDFADLAALRLDTAQCRAVVAITERVRERLLSQGYPADKLLVLPSGVNANTRIPRPERARSWRSFLLAGGYRRVVSYSGGMQEERGIEHVLSAAQKMPDVRFVFLGGTEADLATWRDELGRRRLSNCKVLGYHPHEAVCEVQQASDCVVFTRAASGRPEVTSPLKFFEYLTSGVPIVAASVPALQALPEGLDCRFYDPAEPDSLWSALLARLERSSWPRTSEANVAFGLRYSWEMRQRALLDFIGPFEVRTTF